MTACVAHSNDPAAEPAPLPCGGVETRRVDVVVVGAGTAGANAAYQLAAAGRSVCLIDRRPADSAGAQWHNGVLAWQFHRAGITPPQPPERSSAGATFRTFGPDGTPGPVVEDSPTMRADMAMLGARLRLLATDAGVEVIDGVEVAEVFHHGERMTALEVRAAPGVPARAVRFESDLFVDASGRSGALRRRSPLLSAWCPAVEGSQLCAAADYALRVADRDGARRFLDDHDANPGEHVNRLGTHGGWSTRSITVSEDFSEASILVGCVADGRFATVPGLLADARSAAPWLGEPISGGTGLIPLRRPYARLTTPGLALVGDAACQVFPAHGSGIGIGLIAGRMLAEALIDHADPGAAAALWSYQSAFHRTYGPTLVAYDAVRAMSTKLGSDGVAQMVRAGLLSEPMTRAGLDQRWVTPPLRDTAAMAGRLRRHPRLAATMLPALARGQVAMAIARTYPEDADESALARWDSRVTAALGRR